MNEQRQNPMRVRSRPRAILLPSAPMALLVFLALACTNCRFQEDKFRDCVMTPFMEIKRNPSLARTVRCESDERVWLVVRSGPVARATLVSRGLPDDLAWTLTAGGGLGRDEACIIRRTIRDKEVEVARTPDGVEIQPVEMSCFIPDVPVPPLSVAEGRAFDLVFRTNGSGAALTTIEAIH